MPRGRRSSVAISEPTRRAGTRAYRWLRINPDALVAKDLSYTV
jgi:hypothetical protein